MIARAALAAWGLVALALVAACDGEFRFDELDGGVAIADGGIPDGATCASNADCPATAPLCDVGAGACVACFHSSDCPLDHPRCTPDHRCVECLDERDDCAPPLTCELVSGDCNPRCQEETDCPAATPTCDEVHGVCAFCTSDAICATDEPVCDTTTGLCRKCTNDAECPVGRPRCDSSGACAHCLTNADCAAGRTCDPLQHDCV